MQRFMEHVLRPVFHRNVAVYLDDIPVFSKTKEEHIETLKMIMQRLPEIDLLGVKISAQGFRMEEKKVTEIREWKAPRNQGR